MSENIFSKTLELFEQFDGKHWTKGNTISPVAIDAVYDKYMGIGLEELQEIKTDDSDFDYCMIGGMCRVSGYLEYPHLDICETTILKHQDAINFVPLVAEIIRAEFKDHLYGFIPRPDGEQIYDDLSTIHVFNDYQHTRYKHVKIVLEKANAQWQEKYG